MRIEHGMGEVFKRWQELTDAYAGLIEAAMLRRDPRAAAELGRLAKDIEKHETDFMNGVSPNGAGSH